MSYCRFPASAREATLGGCGYNQGSSVVVMLIRCCWLLIVVKLSSFIIDDFCLLQIVKMVMMMIIMIKKEGKRQAETLDNGRALHLYCGSLTPFVRSEQLVESSLAILVLDYQRSTWKTFVRVRVRFV